MEVKYREEEVTPRERAEVIAKFDEMIAIYSNASSVYHEEKLKDREGKVPIKSLAKFLEMVESTAEFSAMVIADCAVAQKFFVMATSDYEKRFARGKLRVILNEGFKRVFGFTSNKKKKNSTIWAHISEFVSIFPENIKYKYYDIRYAFAV